MQTPNSRSQRYVGWSVAAGIAGVLVLAAALASARWRYGWQPVTGHHASAEVFRVDDYGIGRGYSPELAVYPGSPLHTRITRWLDGLRGFHPTLVTYVPSLSIRCEHMHANLTTADVVINYAPQPNTSRMQMERPLEAADRSLRRDLALLVALCGESSSTPARP